MPPRSSKKKKAKAPGSPKDKPPADVYVGLLFVSLLGLIGGILFLVLELNQYNWQLTP